MPARSRSWLLEHVRLLIAVAVGAGIFLALPHPWQTLTRALTAWNAAVLVLLPLIFMHHAGLSAAQLRERSVGTPHRLMPEVSRSLGHQCLGDELIVAEERSV